MNCSIALQILPQGTAVSETLTVVDTVIAYLKSQPIEVEVSAFETTIQGDYDQLMAILKKAIVLAGEQHSRIFANVKISYNNEGEVLTIDEKTNKYH